MLASSRGGNIVVAAAKPTPAIFFVTQTAAAVCFDILIVLVASEDPGGTLALSDTHFRFLARARIGVIIQVRGRR